MRVGARESASVYYCKASLRGGSPDPPRTCLNQPARRMFRAVGQETHRARGYVALWY